MYSDTFGDGYGIIFSDTDSIAGYVHGDKSMTDLIRDNTDRYDLAEYDKSHPLFDPSGKKVAGRLGEEYPINYKEANGLTNGVIEDVIKIMDGDEPQQEEELEAVWGPRDDGFTPVSYTHLTLPTKRIV